MSKLTLVLFVTAVIITSVIAISIPAANALTARNSFNDNHYTARYAGGQKICGDHICAPGEYDQMQDALAQAQMKGKKETTLPPTTTTPVQNTPSTSVCQTVQTTLTNAGISATVIAKVMTDLSCS